MFGKEATEEMTVSEFDPPNHYLLTAKGCGCRYLTTYRFADAGDSATEVRLSFDARPQSFAARILSILMAPMIKACRKAAARDLADLKREAANEPGDHSHA